MLTPQANLIVMMKRIQDENIELKRDARENFLLKSNRELGLERRITKLIAGYEIIAKHNECDTCQDAAQIAKALLLVDKAEK